MSDLCPAPRRAFFCVSFLGRSPKPALLFLIAKKVNKKASPLGTYKIYFEPGILQPFFQGLHPLPALLFFIAKKDPAGRLAKRLAPELLLLELHSKPALLFLIAEKEGKKASTPGSHKIYFYTGILQLPTVGQVKCLYNSVKNKFYRRLQRGALNGNNKQQQQK